MNRFNLVVLLVFLFCIPVVQASVNPTDALVAFPAIWEQIADNSTSFPGGRVDFVMQFVNLTHRIPGFALGLILFGGSSGFNYVNTPSDFWWIDTQTMQATDTVPWASDSLPVEGRWGAATAVFTNDFGQSEFLILFGGGTNANYPYSEYSDDILRLDFLINGFRWSTVQAPSVDGLSNGGPFARSYVSWNFVHPNHLYLLGGNGCKDGIYHEFDSTDADYDDEWLYDLQSGQWNASSLYNVSIAPNFINRPYSDYANYPPLSEGHNQVVTPDGYVYQFGHYSCTYSGQEDNEETSCFHNTLYEKNLLTGEYNSYDQLNCTTQACIASWPQERAYTSMTFIPEYNWLVVFGGKFESTSGVQTFMNDVNAWDRNLHIWRSLTISGTIPTQRWSHRVQYIGNLQLVLFGGELGSTGSDYMTGLYRLNLGLEILPSNVFVYGQGISVAYAGQQANFTIAICTIGNNNSDNSTVCEQQLSYGTGLANALSVQLAGSSLEDDQLAVTQIGLVTELGNGLYSATYTLTAILNPILVIRLNYIEIPTSPFRIQLIPAGIDASTTTAPEASTSQSTVKYRAVHTLTLAPRDEYGNLVTTSLSQDLLLVSLNGQSIQFQLVDQFNVVYDPFTTDSTLQVGSTYRLNVSYNGIAIQSSPFTITVVQGDVLPGDPLVLTTNAPFAILAIVFAVLGSWTTLILLEQAIFDRKSTAHWKTYTLSILVASIAYGLCAGWSTMYIALNQISVGLDNSLSLDFAIFLPYCFGSMVILVVACALSFRIMLQGIVPSTTSTNGKSSNRRASLVEELGAAVRHIDTTDRLSAVSSLEKILQQKRQQPTAATNNNHTSAVELINQANNKSTGTTIANAVANRHNSTSDSHKSAMAEFQQVLCCALFHSFSWRSFLSGLILFSALVFCEAVVFTSLSTDASTRWNVMVLLALSVSYMLFVPAFQCFFYLVRYRFLGALCMAAALTCGNQLTYLSVTFYYDPNNNTSASSGYTSPSNLVIAASIIGALTCFSLLGLQFRRMKLSRNSLDIMVRKLKQEIRKSKEENRLHKTQLQNQEQTIDLHKSILTTMATLRPNYNATIAGLCLTAQPIWNRATLDQLILQNQCVEMDHLHLHPQDIQGRTDSCSSGRSEEKLLINNNNNNNNNSNNTNSTPSGSSKQQNRPSSNQGHHSNNNNNNNNSAQPTSESVELSVADRIEYMPQLLQYLQQNAVDTPLKRIVLHDLLNNPITLELFKDTLAKELASENIEFYALVQQYKSEFADDNKLWRQSLGAQILVQYVQEHGPLEVNISSSTRSDIMSLYRSKGVACFTANLFDMAALEIYNLMNRDTLTRFERTPQWIFCHLILRAFQDHQLTDNWSLESSQSVES